MKKLMIAAMVVMASLMSIAGTVCAEQLDDKTQQALVDAIQDEYKTRALYQKVIDTFGEVRPFSNIVKGEEQHIEELKLLFEKYGVDVPKDEWHEKVPEFTTIQDACEAGIKAEIENVKMYDKLLPSFKEQDIIDGFTYLRDSSQNKHLSSLQRCVNTGGTGRGRRAGAQGRGRNQ